MNRRQRLTPSTVATSPTAAETKLLRSHAALIEVLSPDDDDLGLAVSIVRQLDEPAAHVLAQMIRERIATVYGAASDRGSREGREP